MSAQPYASSPDAGRRRAVRALGLAGGLGWAAGLASCASPRGSATSRLGRVLVVGGGYGGATAAKYLKHWGGDAIDVTLVEREPAFVSCPLSNLVLGGSRRLEELTVGYDGLRRLGIQVVRDEVVAIDAATRRARFARAPEQAFDRIVVSPGVAFDARAIQGYDEAAQRTVLHAWRAGPQTVALRAQLEAMRDGGVFVISIPLAPYRCPPGPYERACQVAHYLKAAKPRSKIVILDANPDITSKPALFKRVFAEQYKGLVEYRPNTAVTELDARERTFVSELGDRVRGDVLNLIPPQSAGAIARGAGLVNANDRWCLVDWMTMESTAARGVHVLGDATLPASAMPKSGHMANQHGKAAAAAIVELLNGRTPPPPTMANNCYSYTDDRQVIHVASVHRYDAQRKTMLPVEGAGGLSGEPNRQEGVYAWAWAQTIWKDMLS